MIFDCIIIGLVVCYFIIWEPLEWYLVNRKKNKL
jgi:hypothetical protein